MSEADHPNVDMIRRGFDALTAGDMATAMANFSPEVSGYGADASGRPKLLASIDDIGAIMLEAVALNDEYENELVDAYAVGDSLVMAHLRGHRRSRRTQEALDFDYVMAFRIEDGQITRSVDLLDARSEAFFGRLAE